MDKHGFELGVETHCGGFLLSDLKKIIYKSFVGPSVALSFVKEKELNPIMYNLVVFPGLVSQLTFFKYILTVPIGCCHS